MAQLRERLADRCRYNRERIVRFLAAGDEAVARRHADRLAADAMTDSVYDPQRPGALRGVNTDRLSDDELAGLLSDPGVVNDEAAVDYVLYELDARGESVCEDRADYSVRASSALLSSLGEMRRARAHADEWHTSVEALDRLLAGPLTGENRMRLLGLFSPRSDRGRVSKKQRIEEARKEHRALMHHMFVAAETECRGNLLNRQARRAGVDPRDLFSRSAQWVRANASEEFLRWRESNPRLTQAQYVAEVVGDERSRRDAATARANAKVMVL